MTPEQARFARAGAAMVAAQVRGDAVGRDLLIERVVADRGLARLVDAFTYAAVAAVARAAGGRGVPFELVLAGVPRRCRVLLVPSAGAPWDVAVGLVSAAQRGGRWRAEVAATADIGGVINATFGFAVSAFRDLQAVAGPGSDPTTCATATGDAGVRVSRHGWVRPKPAFPLLTRWKS